MCAVRQSASEDNLRRLLALQERERRLLACEIHDTFVQELVTAQLAIDQLVEHLLKSDPESVESLLKIRARVRKAMDDARVLIGELRPADLDHLNLPDSIQDVVDQVNAQHHLDVRLVQMPGKLEVDPVLKASIVRVVQEALHNVARHAKTKQATVQLAQVGQKIRISVTDPGVGFDPKKVGGDRFGLAGIRERAQLFGGKATVRSRPGGGTTVTAEFLTSAPVRASNRDR